MLRSRPLVCLVFTSAVMAAPPETLPMPVVDVHHGVSVTDEYRWLENWSDPAVKAWSDAQNVHARAVLDQLPGVATLQGKLTQIMAAESTSHGHLVLSHGRLFVAVSIDSAFSGMVPA